MRYADNRRASDITKIRIAFAHDWLVVYAGAGKVLSEMLSQFPNADLYRIVDFSKGKFGAHFLEKTFRTSFPQKFRFIPKIYRHLIPLMMHSAKAFIFAAEEDFGITPQEAGACGTPVLAYGRGAASETVVDEITGLHFWDQSVEAICDVVNRFETSEFAFDPKAIRKHAERFSNARFRFELNAEVRASWNAHYVRSTE